MATLDRVSLISLTDLPSITELYVSIPARGSFLNAAYQVTMHGITLAEGTVIGANAWVMHLNEEIM